jgi:hypothetical protein
MAMIRKQVYIAPQQDKMLKRLARQSHKTEAEIIRTAIDAHAQSLMDKEKRMKAWRAIEATADRMKQLPPAATRSWTREDLYDRYDRAHSLGHKRSRVRV